MHVISKDLSGTLMIVSLDNIRAIIMTPNEAGDMFKIGIVGAEDTEKQFGVFWGEQDQCEKAMECINDALEHNDTANLLDLFTS